MKALKESTTISIIVPLCMIACETIGPVKETPAGAETGRTISGESGMRLRIKRRKKRIF